MTTHIYQGNAWVYGDDIDTDRIFPGKYLDLTDPQQMAPYAFEGVDPMFLEKIHAGDFIVAGKNFGCGSSREQAAIVLRENKISAIIAVSFARIFYRNAINLGLPPIIAPQIATHTKDHDQIQLDLKQGTITNVTQNIHEIFPPFPGQILDILTMGGLIPLLQKRLHQVG